MNKPKFIIAGFQKCATTALLFNIEKHHEIQMARPRGGPEHIPEMDYFCTRHDLGDAWYSSHFPENGKVWGEKSANYGYAGKGIAQKIHQFNPDQKLIFLLRHPADRAFSAYNHCRVAYDEEGTDWGWWDSAGDIYSNLKDPSTNFIVNSDYVKTLSEYLQFFPMEQLHIIVQEELLGTPDSVYPGLFDFIGVTNIPIESKVYHKRDSEPKVEEQKQLRAYLHEYFRPMCEQLFNLIGRDIPSWNY
jgi:hypothetical protein